MPKNTRSRPNPHAQALQDALRPGQSVELLQHLHILTRDGRLNQDSRRKLKQVHHLYQFIEALLLELPQQGRDAVLADLGAGKSYLGFIVYDLFFRQRAGQVLGVETRSDLVQRSRDLAQKLGFDRMDFLSQSVAAATKGAAALPQRVDVVTALHACDTATDEAIAFGLQKQAQAMALVPCCQAEVAALLRADKAQALARTPLAELWRHPMHTREFGSHLTNALRCLYLESQGYQVTVTELTGWEHSLKNELILARRTGHRKHTAARRLRRLLDEFGLRPLLRLRFAALCDDGEAGTSPAQ